MNRNFWLLWQGQLVSQLGNQVALVGMILLLKQTTDNATVIGLVTMIRAIPSVLLGPVGGTFADRYSRRSIIIYGDLLNGIAVLAVTFLIFLHTEQINLIIFALFLLSSFTAIIDSFFKPAVAAAIPDLVPSDKVAQANSLHRASVQMATFVGYGLGGILFGIFGPSILFLINGLTYIISAGTESCIHIPQVIIKTNPNWKKAFKDFQGDILAGFRYIEHYSGLKAVFLAAASLNTFSTSIFVLLPFYVEDFLRQEAHWYGFLMAAFGVGCLTGYIIVSAIPFSAKVRSKVIITLVFIPPLLFCALGLFKLTFVSLLIMFSIGMVITTMSVLTVTIIQITTPSQMRGRVIGLLITCSQVLTPIAMGMSGWIADSVNQNIPLIYFICGILSFLVALSLSINQKLHSFLAYEEE